MRKYRYQLSQSELTEALLCLDYRIEGWFKRFNTAVLTLLGAVLLYYYLKYPDRFYFAIGGFLVIILLFGILYVPALKRRGRAAKMAKGQGYYEFKLAEKGFIGGDSAEEILFEGKQTLLFDSENVLTLSIQKEVYCIPKRVVLPEFTAELKAAVKLNGGRVYNVNTDGRMMWHGKRHDGENRKAVSK